MPKLKFTQIFALKNIFDQSKTEYLVLVSLEIEQCSQKGMCPCFFHVNAHLHQTPKCGNSRQSSGKHIIIVARYLVVIKR